jgi:hypothetical protein
MLKISLFGAALVALALASSPFVVAAETARAADLAWMTGTWAGPLGDQTLEENWTQPQGGSITSLIRFTGGGETSMIEMIVIEEEGESLVFRVRQWSPGFVPRTAEPQTMFLAEIGERRVRFEATQPGAFQSLTYSRPTAESFNIDVETGTGQGFQIQLRAQ